MLKFLALSLVLTSLAHAKPMVLECELEDYDEDKIEFEMKGVENPDGTISFSDSDSGLYTYFFPSYGPAVWHTEAKYEFQARLDGEKLTYQYKFYNNLRAKNTVTKVFDETREIAIDFYEVEYDDDFSFDDDDGALIASEVNHDDWINEKGIEFKECKISYEIENEDEDENIQTRRGFFSRLFNL